MSGITSDCPVPKTGDEACDSQLQFGQVNIEGATSGEAVSLVNNDQSLFHFDDLSITTTGARGLVATNTGTLSVATGDISASGGNAIEASETELDMTLASVTATGGGSGLDLFDVTGQVTVSGTLSATDAAASGIKVSNSVVDVDVNRVTVANSGGAGIV